MLTDIEKQREEQAKAAAAKSTSEGAPAEGAAGQEKADEKAEDKAAEDKAAGSGKAVADKATPALKLTLPEQGGGKVAHGAPGKLAADLKVARPKDQRLTASSTKRRSRRPRRKS
jgi:hypothetical protein